MLVPSLMVKLHEADTTLHQPAREQAVIGERGFSRLGAVQGQRFLGSLAMSINPERSTASETPSRRSDARRISGSPVASSAQLIQLNDLSECRVAPPSLHAFGVGEVKHRVAATAELHTLVNRGKESAPPHEFPPLGPFFPELITTNAGNLSLPNPVRRRPRPHAGAPELHGPGVHQELSRRVVESIRLHGLYDRDVIHHLRKVRKQLGKSMPDLSVLGKLEFGTHELASWD